MDQESLDKIKELSASRISFVVRKDDEEQGREIPLIGGVAMDQEGKRKSRRGVRVEVVGDASEEEYSINHQDRQAERIKQYYMAKIALNSSRDVFQPLSPTSSRSPSSRNLSPRRSGGGSMFSWDAEEPQTRVDYWIYVSVVIASLTMIQAGFNIGLTSGAILIVQERFGLSSLEKEAVMASLNISAIFGVFIINYISDWKGRKSAIVCSSFILAVGFFITVFSKGFISFLVARIIAGFGLGGGVFVSQQYSSEIVPVFLRKWVILYSEVILNFGIVLGYIMNYSLHFQLGWRFSFSLGIIPSIIIFLVVRFLYKSPYWLIMRERNEEAEDLLLKIYDFDEISSKHAARHIKVAFLLDNQNSWSSIFHPYKEYRKMLFVGFFLAALQQLCGSETVLVYAPDIFAKFPQIDDIYIFPVALGIARFIFSLLALFFIDKAKRKRTMLICSFFMSISLVFVCLTVKFYHGRDQLVFYVLSGLLVYSSVYALGFGSSSWLYISELFPLRIRSREYASSIAIDRFFSGVLMFLFPCMIDLSFLGTFIFFAGFCIVSIGFAFFLKETKGKTFQEISESFDVKFVIPEESYDKRSIERLAPQVW